MIDTELTIVVPTHNRHHYLGRLISYYKDFKIPIIIVDSTNEPYELIRDISNISYLHLPHTTFTSKLEIAFEQVHTKFTVLTADDDFLILSGLNYCVDFLNNNDTYSVAVGNVISYVKGKGIQKYVDFRLLYYDRFEYDFSEENELVRLNVFFKNYRTLFSAIHYTKNLQTAFESAGKVVKNLFLNEYLTVIVPIISGNIKQLPILFQIRESSEESDDKTTKNIDDIIVEQEFKSEYDDFLNHQSFIISTILNKDLALCKNELTIAFTNLAASIKGMKQNVKVPKEKKIGRLISKVPFVGYSVIMLFRRTSNKRSIRKVVFTDTDFKVLENVSFFIKSFSHVTNK